MKRDFDVIIVGAGGSGLAAACAAAAADGEVLLLEKRPQPGGTTGIAVGSFTAAGTRLQKAADIQDHAQHHAEDAALFAPAEIESKNQDELRQFFLSEAAATYAWLETLGLHFVGPHHEPPNRQPRMHNVVPGAKAYIATLQSAFLRFGGTLLCEAQVTALLQSDRRVVGVTVQLDSEVWEFTARRGVILAAGDFASNSELIAEYKGEQFRDIEGINPYAQGEGQRLVRDVGGKLVNMEVTYGPELRFVTNNKQPFQQWLPATGPAAHLMGRIAPHIPRWIMRLLVRRLLVTWQHPEDALFRDGAILVNADGQRFINESSSPDREIAVAHQTKKEAYLLMDGRLVTRYSSWPHFVSTAPDIAYAYVNDYQRLRPDVTVTGYHLKDLALRRGIDADRLEQTVQEFNAYVRGEQPDAFGRSGDEHELELNPWVLMGPLRAYFTTTEGGAAINTSLQVLDEEGAPIPGLYAVGQNGLGGMILWSHGLHIAWAMTSGRLAGEQVMREPIIRESGS